MKKNLILATIAAVFGFISCTNDQDITTTDQPEAVTFTIRTEPLVTTRAAAPTVPSKDTRYIIELWSADKSTKIERIVQLNNPAFSLILDKSLAYYVAVWVDYVNDVDDATGTPVDHYYVTTDFKRIILNSLDGSPGAFDPRKDKSSNLPSRDAFTGVFAFPAGPPYPTTVQVKRPLARINVISTDAGIWKDRPELNGDTVYVRMTNPGYYTYNILTQRPTETGINVEYISKIPESVYKNFPDATNQTVLAGLYFANIDSTSNLPSTQNFNIYWSVGTGSETNITIPALSFKRNYNTNITGGLLFNSVNFNIDTNPSYDKPDVNAF